MRETLIGYARCSTDAQDLTAQRDRLRELGVAEERVYLDLDQALAAVPVGDTLVVPKLDRRYWPQSSIVLSSLPLARSWPSGLNARDCTEFLWPMRRPTGWPARTFHKHTILPLADARSRPSGLNVTISPHQAVLEPPWRCCWIT